MSAGDLKANGEKPNTTTPPLVKDSQDELNGQPPTITLAAAGLKQVRANTGLPTPRIENASSGLAAFISSPRAVMILGPLLVLVLGATLTLIGQAALGATSKKMATERFVEQTTSVSLRLENALGQAEPLLDELARLARASSKNPDWIQEAPPLDPSNPDHQRLKSLALEMRDLLIGRQAITQAYIAFTNGKFLSADPSGPRSVDFQITHKGQSNSYRVQGQDLVATESKASSYDPRSRDWFHLAREKGERVWSEPYSFFFNRHPGVTRAVPIYSDRERTKLIAVVGVDFDVDALTHFMASGESTTETVKSVVFSRDGVVLAYPSGAKKLQKLPRNKEVPQHEALGDARLSALVSEVQSLSAVDIRPGLIEFEGQNERILASVRQVGADVPNWYVATFSPQATILHELYEHRKRSLIIGMFSLCVAMVMAWLLAKHLLFVRRIASEAQAAAKDAHDQIRNLGSYRLISQIGEGGMGEVWRARHRLLAREAAIKLIKQDNGDDSRREEHQERFRREAQAIAGLRSRNTVALFDYGLTPDGTLFYVMELLDGIDLSTLVTRYGKQTQERVRQILLQACNSLAEAHAAQLVHRDIKPANLFLCREAQEVDVIKVLDFGLVSQVGLPEVPRSQGKPDDETVSLAAPTPPLVASASSGKAARITRTDHQLGTPAFMSPEQAIGGEMDRRSDLYSLACVAWWLLTGDPIFSAKTQLALMLKHIENDTPDLDEAVGSSVDPRFKKILLQCLEKSPDDRPQSAQELGKALRDVGALEPRWTEQDALNWWGDNMPSNVALRPNLSIPPLRDAELLRPFTS